ncbi:MAG TPA: preprotein translocase subunit SecE [Candidatus Paceibacterota bacterium]|nr:preprotein translocase subunit SecE [Candidatus Paceibacterota bacterium]
MSKLSSFFRDVVAELQRVNWPTRQETLKYTAVVIGASAAVAVFLGALDLLFSTILSRFII